MGNSVVKLLYLIIGVLVLAKDVDKNCKLKEIPSGCGKLETCTEGSDGVGRCKCLAGQKRNNEGVCSSDPAIPEPFPGGVTPASRILPPDTTQDSITSGSSVAAGILIPLAVIACLVSVVFLARRYRWPQRLRQLRARHYDEMQIGQDDDDDPPIA